MRLEVETVVADDQDGDEPVTLVAGEQPVRSVGDVGERRLGDRAHLGGAHRGDEADRAAGVGRLHPEGDEPFAQLGGQVGVEHETQVHAAILRWPPQ